MKLSEHPVEKANRESRLEKLPFDRLEKSLKKYITEQDLKTHKLLRKQIKDKVERIESLETKYDLVTKELQKLNEWRRKHLRRINNSELVLRKLGKIIISAFTILNVPDNRIESIEKELKTLGGDSWSKIDWEKLLTMFAQSLKGGDSAFTDTQPSKDKWKQEPTDDLGEHIDKIIYPYSDKHIVVEKAEFELCLERLQHFLDVYLKGYLLYPDRYEEWNRDLLEHEEKYLGDEISCYHLWRYFNKWCQACCEFGHGVIVSHCFKCGVYWDAEFGFWSQEEIDNLFFNQFFHDNFPPLCDTLKEIEVLTKKKNNKKIAQDTDKKSKN